MGEREYLLGIEKWLTVAIGDERRSVEEAEECGRYLSETQFRLKELDNPDSYEMEVRAGL